MRKAAMTIQAWRVDRRTTRAIAAMSGGLVSFTMRPGWRTWFAAGVNLDDYARRRRIFVATLNCAAFLSRNACSVVIRGKQRMSHDDGAKIVYRRTPESAAMLANVKRAMAITARLNRLTFDDADEIRALISELTGKKVVESFMLIPPFFTAGGDEIRVGRNVFVNQNCTFYDLGGVDIADDVLIGPNVSLITAGHPLEPSQRRAVTIGRPIVIEKNVWIAAGATIIGGVTVGENSVVAAGSVVTKDVHPNTLVGGNPAKVIRLIGD